MSEERKIKIVQDGDLVMAVVIAFILFWAQSGWYRVDCALGIQAACNRIASEKDYAEPRP
jgi:hypothetical protein